AEQFAYLVAGAPLDRAVLLGTIPPEERIVAGASEGVETFLARYGT
ncbi:MAG: TetR/AcrR family transcriptional regulator C-terminal domain-containing protein, partial [Gemmatimonadota bacterium]